jgi:hypothetical protein
MQKPTGITITAGLMALILVVGLAITFTAAVPPMPQMPNFSISASTFIMAIRVVAIVFTIIAAVFVWFYWNGQNWARWLVMIDCVFCLFPLIHLARNWQISPLGSSLTVFKAVLAIFLLWYLNTREIRNWYSPSSAPGQPTAY